MTAVERNARVPMANVQQARRQVAKRERGAQKGRLARKRKRPTTATASPRKPWTCHEQREGGAP
eukprot:11167333-Lingulodinium_polyedra.AAC.1